jgi:Ca-activated chloride channel family protein
VHPEWLASVLGALALTALALAAARLASRRRRARVAPGTRPGLSLARDAALLVALACIGAALLGPRIGERSLRVPASGVDVVLLVDVSRSMDAADVPPSRLARARRAAEEVLMRLAPGDRAALAVFAGRGALLTPLTPDREALAELLPALDTSLVEPASSDLASGVRAALAAFENGSERPRVLFVLSDGEDPERRSSVGAAEALRAAVRVVALGLGGDAGAEIDDHGVPLRDPEQRVVVSRRDMARLERLAAATGGRLFAADAWGAFDVGAVAAEVRRDAGRGHGDWVERRIPAVRVWPLAALAFALLAAEGLPGPRRSTFSRFARAAAAAPRGRRAWRAAAALALCAVAIGAGPPPATDESAAPAADPRALVELGLARLAHGQHEAAERAFFAAALATRDPELAALAWYDLGVSALERGDAAAARDAFFDALALDPADREARFDLAWALDALARAASEEPPEKPPDEAPPPAPPPPAPRAPGAAPAEAGETRPPVLDEALRQRWLARVRDDPRRALALAAGSGEAPHERAALAW